MTLSHSAAERIGQLQAQMAQAGVDLIALAPTANMRYLLGFAPLADERPCFLLVSRQATELVVPELNADQVEAHTGRRVIRWADAAGPQQALAKALHELGVKPNPILAVDDSMRADILLRLQAVTSPQRSIPAGHLMSALRMQKSEAEVAALRRAAGLADEALLAGAESCRPGVTERQVARDISRYFLENGAEVVDFILVASGPNSAFPHHDTGSRELQLGDTVILDIGATLDGYKSDITRVVHLGRPSKAVQTVYEAVRQANRQAQQAVVAGAAARDVDRAARSVIEQAGYGPYFIHRTGHGLGLEGHELPSINSENELILKPGMVFSIEPGIYLQGKFGIRIEDIVVVTNDGCHCLTGLDHDLIIKL